MKYVIWGAGVTGRRALNGLGNKRVLCFADKNCAGKEIEGKKVILPTELPSVYEENEVIVVIASEKYWREMELQLQEMSNIKRYFIFHERDVQGVYDILPNYMLCQRARYISYLQALANYRIWMYKRIAIYGTNEYLPYLISEIMIQNPTAEIVVIKKDSLSDVQLVGCKECFFYECKDEIDCLILNVKRSEDSIYDLLDAELNRFAIVGLYAQEQFEPTFQYEGLKKYKDIHKGKRCFIVGNGPSLRFEDLEKLREQGEICFAFNKMYRAYDRTKWRADYYGMTDWRVVVDLKEGTFEIPGTVFVGDHTYHNGRCMRIEGVEYFHAIVESFYPNLPGFSDDMTKGFYNGFTVTYDVGLQLAAYMGFQEIYLLGVDHDFNGIAVGKENHFIDNYYTDQEFVQYKAVVFETEKATKQYEKAELYSRQHGFRIYNATRGGKLEVFERVDFDSLFSK